MKAGMCLIATVVGALTTVASAGLTGNPYTDGWTSGGHSLSNGVYVRTSENVNYAFDTYSTSFSVASGSGLPGSWLVGDSVIGAGGVFTDPVSAAAAGWGSIPGNQNEKLGASISTRFQVKFGTADATWSPSTLAPASGDGLGSGSMGGLGMVQIRTTTDTDTGRPGYWSTNSGLLMELDKTTHATRTGTSNPSTDVARLIWNWDADAGHVSSWQILLNTSLLDRLAPGTFTGKSPGAGNLAIMTVQNGDGGYTDALVEIQSATVPIPAPGVALLMTFGVGLVGWFKRRLA